METGLTSIPGVISAGVARHLPLSDKMGVGFGVRTEDMPEGVTESASWIQVTPNCFQAIGIRLIAGRPLSMPASATKPEVVLSTGLATTLFGGSDAIGRRVWIDRGANPEGPITVVGIVDDVRLKGPDSTPSPTLYQSFYVSASQGHGYAVRVAGDPVDVVDAVRRTLESIDPTVPPFAVRSTRLAFAERIAARRALAVVSNLFGVVAVILAALGLYGLLAEAVARKRREIGVRIALGARAHSLVSSVVRRGLGLTVLGVALSAPLILGSTRLLDKVLFETDARDPLAIGLSTVILLLVSLVASWLPAPSGTRQSGGGALVRLSRPGVTMASCPSTAAASVSVPPAPRVRTARPVA